MTSNQHQLFGPLPDAEYQALKVDTEEHKGLIVPTVKPVEGKFRTIVVDPPWDYESLSLVGLTSPSYAVMSLEEIEALDILKWAEDECHLYLWTGNNYFLSSAGKLMGKWGFEYKTALTWIKPHFGLGSPFLNSSEVCLFGVRGELTTRVDDIDDLFETTRGKHSEKPDLFYELVQRASYAPYLDVFGHKRREGWSAWGSVSVSGDTEGR